MARQPCDECGKETYLDAYIRPDSNGKRLVLCEHCCNVWDIKDSIKTQTCEVNQ